jgi:lysophospholipase L1-like esterase
MSEFKFHHFGHSFPKRIFNYVKDNHKTVHEVINPPELCKIFIDGYSGLTYKKLFDDPDRFLHKLKRNNNAGPIDVISIDMGTNDLCNPSTSVEDLVVSALSFIDLLLREGIRPKYIVFFSIIQRTEFTRTHQVTVSCFNHRIKKFNKMLALELKSKYDWVFMFSQRRINFPKYCEDGVHFTPEGRRKYCAGLRSILYKYKQKLLVSGLL